MSHPSSDPPQKQESLPPPEEKTAELSESEVVEEVEELDENLLTQVDSTPPAESAIDKALGDAKAALSDEKKLVHLYEREMEALGSEDKAKLALYQHEVGELYEASGDEGAAVKAYAKALQSDATLKPNLWAIRRVFQRRALWPNLLKLIDAEIRFARSDAEKAELYVEKGQLFEDKLNDVQQARECYWKATEADAGTLAAWLSLEKLCAKDGDLAGLAKVLRGAASATHEPARKVALLLDLARLQDNLDGGSLEKALELCREAAQVGESPERALDELERLAEEAQKPEELLTALELRIEVLSKRAREVSVADRLNLNDEIVALRRRQASVARAQNSSTRAWDFLQKAVELRPDEPLILRDLIDLGDKLGRHAEVIPLYQRRAESAPEPFQIALTLERAAALRRAGLHADAEALENEVLAKVPGHLGLMVQRERAAMDSADWSKLATLYVSEAELARTNPPTGNPDPRWAAGALVAAATVYEAHLENDADAIRLLIEALSIDREYRPAIEALERIYARTGKHADLAALIEKELQSESQPSRKLRLVETLVGLREVRLEDPAGAADAQKLLVQLRPDDVRSRLRLIELSRAAGRFADAAEELHALAQKLPASDVERRAELLLERAELLERRIEDMNGAALAYKEVLALRPGEPRALLAVESISRRRAAKSGAHELSPQDWDDLAGALRREAESSLSPERVTAVLLKLGDVHERERGSFAEAAQAYRDLLDKNPGHPAALRGLVRAYERLGDAARHAEAVEQLAEVVDGEPRGEALVALGELYEDKLDKDESAEDAYGRAVAAGGLASYHAAFGRLRTAARKKDASAIGAALEKLGAFADEIPAARAGLLDERATMEKWAGDAARAGELAADAIRADENALSPQLHQLRARARESQPLAPALAQLAAKVADQNLKVALERRAALLGLGVGDKAVVERLQRARQYGGADPTVILPLADLSTDPEVLGARAQLAEGAGRVAFLVERAEALENAGRLAEAAAEIGKALELDPKNLWARELQRRVALAGNDGTSWARATVLLADEVQEAERAAALYNQAASTLDELGIRDEAAAAYRAVLDRTPRDGVAFKRARVLLGSLYSDNQDPAPLVELLTHRLESADSPADRIPLHLDRAEILAAEHDREGAERDLRAVLRDEPGHLEAMRKLAHILGHQAAAREEAIQLYTRYLEGETDKHKRRQANLELADFEEAAGRLEEAVKHLEAALETAPRASEEERLAELLVHLRQWQRAVQALRRLAALTADPGERARVEIRIASIYRDGFADPKAAVESLIRALHSEPLQMEALGRLVNMAEGGHVVALELEEQLDRAIEKARGLVAGAPMQPDAYMYLSRLWGWRGDEDARVFAAQAMALTAVEPPPPREGAHEPTRELSPMGWERLLPPGARSVALEIWRAAWEGADKIYGPEVAQLGVGKSDRQNHKGIPMAWVPVDKIARALGCSYQLYTGKDPQMCVVAGEALVVGSAMADRLGPRTRFRVARSLTLLRERLGPLETMSDDELHLFFAACAKVAETARPSVLHITDNAKLEERAKALGKALGRKERNALKGLGPRFADLNDPRDWKRAFYEGAARAALVVGGDLEGALAELNLAPLDLQAGALYAFAVSDDMIALRLEMGLRT
jgi:tetratricopeptide (TPR) repeat protein